MQNNSIFENLFVLEMTNNHKGNIARGLEIIRSFSDVIHSNSIPKVAIKLQFRDLDNIIHTNFRSRTDIRYIRRILETRLEKGEYAELIAAIRDNGCIPMATPFDEASVNWCMDFELPIIKVASVDSTDWFLLEKIAETKKPVIVSTGGTSVEAIDKVVDYFQSQHIPLAINHCIAVYPTEDHELQLNQIDFLKNRYPNNIIGLSSHEHLDWTSSMLIAYGKGCRLFERHIDINSSAEVSPYSCLPDQIDMWFKAYGKAKEMCGDSNDTRKTFSEKEREYLDSYIRGVYAKTDLVKGQVLSREDIYLAIPLLKGQLSTRELTIKNTSIEMLKSCPKDHPITIDMVDPRLLSGIVRRDDIKNRGY